MGRMVVVICKTELIEKASTPAAPTYSPVITPNVIPMLSQKTERSRESTPNISPRFFQSSPQARHRSAVVMCGCVALCRVRTDSGKEGRRNDGMKEERREGTNERRKAGRYELKENGGKDGKTDGRDGGEARKKGRM